MARNGQITGISGSTQTARHEVTVTRVGDKTLLDVNVSSINITQSTPFTVNITAGQITVNNNVNITQTVAFTVNVTNTLNFSQVSPFTVNVTAGQITVTNNVNVTQTVAFTVNVTNNLNITGTVVTVDVGNTASTTVLSITGTNVVEVTGITNQRWLELHPLGFGRVYFSYNSSITPSNVGSFRKIDPYIRPYEKSIFIMVTATAGANIAVYKVART